MTWDLLVKPQFDGLGGGGVVSDQPGHLVVYDAEGNVLDEVEVGGQRGHEGYKQSVSSIHEGRGAYIEFTPQGGQKGRYNLTQPGQRHEFIFGQENPSLVSGKGAVGSFGGGAGGGFAPGSFGGLGFYPAYLGGMFPSPSLIDYNPIESAPYTFTDPAQFAATYGPQLRNELRSNFDLARSFGLSQIDTELEGLLRFVPQAANLARTQIAIDNTFNQGERTRQIDTALPGVRGDLDSQAERARAFAEGRVPDDITDRALELGIRSRAADRASAGGFGATSVAGNKISDLMSAEQRIQLSQYGDQALTSNIRNKADILLAPTEYSNVGSQIRVTPEVGAGRASMDYFGQLNQATIIPASQALQTTVQQNQFTTGLEQNTRQFNASNDLNAQQFNATAENNFKLTEFGYNVSYAGAVAGAGQTAANTQLQLDQQRLYQEIFQNNMQDAQQQGQINSIAQAVGTIGSVVSSVAGFFSGPGGETAGPAIDIPTDVATGGDTGGFETPQTEMPPPQRSPDIDTSTQEDTTLAEGDSFEVDPIEAGGETAGPPVDVGFDAPEVQAFSLDTGIEAPRAMFRSLSETGAKVLNATGVFNQPVPGSVRSGVDLNGNPTYSSKALLESSDTTTGQNHVNSFAAVLNPFKALNDSQKSTLQQIGETASSTAVLASLADAYSRGDKKAFINTVLQSFKQPIINNLTKDPQNRSGLNAAFGAFSLFNNWGQMSPAQKTLGLANVGISAFRYASGTDLAKQVLIDPVLNGKEVVRPGINVGQALDLLASGYNAYSLVKNWDQYSDLQKIAGGTATVAQIANTARNFGMLGTGTQGAAVAANANQLAAAGWRAMPNAGVGALAGSAGSQVPAGYSIISTGRGGTVIVPTANANTAAVAQGSAMSYLQTAGGVAAIALGAQAVYKGWGTGGEKGALNGALGGSSIAAGMYTLGATNPYAMAAVVALSIVGNTVKTGKSEEQLARDGVRKRFKEVGLTSELAGDSFTIALPDGSVANIGVDGHGGEHEIKNRALLTKEHEGREKLNAYDTDYTNDLDYTAALGGIALSRIISGGKATNIDQLGSQLGNASLGKVGYGAEFTRGNYDSVMQNQRAMYAKSGINSKSDAYQLANQAYSEGRINDSELVSMQQAFNLVFDTNSYDTAQRLMAGRQRGIEVAASQPEDSNNFTIVGPTSPKKRIEYSRPAFQFRGETGARPLSMTKEDIRRVNQQRYGVAA